MTEDARPAAATRPGTASGMGAAATPTSAPATPTDAPATCTGATATRPGAPATRPGATATRPGATATRTDAAALAAGLVTVTAWGSAFVAIRAAGHTLSPGAISLGRLVVSSAILGAVALRRREPLPRRRDLAAVATYGVLWLGVYSVTLNAAERLIDAGTAAMIINTGPILITILAGLFLREGFPRGLIAGCTVAFAGCVVIGLATARPGTHTGPGIALCAVAALAYAVAVVVQKHALARVPAFQVTWLGCAAATIACLPFAPALVTEAGRAGAGGIAWTVYLGLVPTALGFATWAFALRRTSAGRMAALAYLIPLVAILLGWAVLGETPPPLALAGGALCLAGVYLARRDSGKSRGGRSGGAGAERERAQRRGGRRGARAQRGPWLTTWPDRSPGAAGEAPGAAR